jgi:hypothetical protein
MALAVLHPRNSQTLFQDISLDGAAEYRFVRRCFSFSDRPIGQQPFDLRVAQTWQYSLGRDCVLNALEADSIAHSNTFTNSFQANVSSNGGLESGLGSR